jgi:CubicO group peptidase (beta-lactamase class C family)
MIRSGTMRLGSRNSILAAAGIGLLFLAERITEAQHTESPELNQRARAARVENGLLPAVTIKGQPAHKMTIADRMKAHHIPGVSVAFFDHGQISWIRTYGFAEAANEKPVSAETLFQAASISKPVSALAALRLVQDGKLNLDQDVDAKLRTWKVPENEFTKEQKVTLRRILSHSAGLTVHGFPGYASGDELPVITQVLDGDKPANTDAIRVDTVPGTLWRYSGGVYVVMQQLLTDATGKPFPRLLDELVLRPIGMTHSTYEQPLPRALWPAAATPYDESGLLIRGGWHTYPEMAAAGLWTTPSDLAKFAIEIQKEYAGRSNRILSTEMIHQMLKPQKDDWGLGFAMHRGDGDLRFGHGGSNAGFECDLGALKPTTGSIVSSAARHIGRLTKCVLVNSRCLNDPDKHTTVFTVTSLSPQQSGTRCGIGIDSPIL